MPTKPARLSPGDSIAIVAPSSPAVDPKTIEPALAFIETLGFRPRFAPNALRRHGFLAGTDRQRAGDLMRKFADKKTAAILCLRGGYGAARILPLLDFSVIRANPKIFIGFSDITSLHCALLTRSNLVSFHGPTLSSEIFRRPDAATLFKSKVRDRKDEGSEFKVQGSKFNVRSSKSVSPNPALECLLRTLTLPAPAGSLRAGFDNRGVRVIRKGTASGPLIGGNLSLLCTTIGTPYQPSFRKAILFLEDVGEPPYRMDRMLTHLVNAGLLQQVAGIAVGTNQGCVDPKADQFKEYRQTTDDVLEERLSRLEIPVVTGLPFGHIPRNATLPVGVRAELDGHHGDLIITEAAVK